MGELAALAAAALWAGATLVFAAAGARLSATLLNLFKTGFGFAGLALTAQVVTGRVWPADLGGPALAWVGLSGILGLTLGDTLYFGSLQLLGARRALVLWALTPAATAVAADLVLGEALHPSFVLGVLLTSVGVALVLFDRTPTTRGAIDRASHRGRVLILGILAGLGSVACQALGSVTAKLGGAGLTGLELSVARLSFGTLALLGPGLWALWHHRASLDRPALGQIAIGTFLGTYLGIWLSMVALQNAFAGVVATLQSTSPIFVLPLARFVFGERIGPVAAGGALLAVAGVAVLTLD